MCLLENDSCFLELNWGLQRRGQSEKSLLINLIYNNSLEHYILGKGTGKKQHVKIKILSC